MPDHRADRPNQMLSTAICSSTCRKYHSGKHLAQVNEAILRLVELHGRGITHESALELTLWPDPDGKYLIKGGSPNVWKKFRLRKEHRRLRGFIHGKRCGITENIGSAAQKRWKKQQVLDH